MARRESVDTLIMRPMLEPLNQPLLKGATMTPKTHTEKIIAEMLRIRKALDRLSVKIEKEPELMASDYIGELSMEIEGAANQVTEAISDRTSNR